MKDMFNLAAFCFLLIAYSCNQSTHKDTTTISNDTSKRIIPSSSNDFRRFGERLSLTGDFNGDGKIDTLFESYISSITGKETFKEADSTDWERNIELLMKNKPVSRLYNNIPGIDTFVVTREPQQSGIAHTENLGDLNNNGGDEVGYIVNWADDSNLNTYHIITLGADGKWRELLKFGINEFVNYEAENLFNGRSVINKVAPGKIQYRFYSDTATIETAEATFR